MPMIRFAARFAFFLIVLAIVAEVFFRTIVPATSVPAAYMGAHDEIFRFDATWTTSGVVTHGRFGLRRGAWRVNNAGWNSMFDYSPASQKVRPRVALLGDSFIEGFPTDVDQHVDSYLYKNAGGRADVYAFGRSGWYLAQYVALSRYVDTEFAPDTFVIFLNYHDLQDSLRENGVKTPYAYQITQDGAGFRELKPPVHFVLSKRSRLLRRSAIVRYVRGNLGITWGQKDAIIEDANLRPAAPAASAEARVTPLVQRATDYMIDRLVAEHPDSQFVFVVDTDRRRIYAGEPVGDRAEFDALVRAARGHPTVHVLDLDPVFRRAYARDHRRFDGADGTHWDPYGNRVVAQAVYDDLTARGLLPVSP
jgi:hypothetical protein